MRLLVYEHASGGGFAERAIPPSVLSEGYGMLQTLVSDFRAAGHQVTVLLDSRISQFNAPLNAGCKIPIYSFQSAKEVLKKASETSDAAYIIAPETGQILKPLIETVERSGVASLNCQISAQKVANKAVLYETLEKAGVPIPQTLTCNVSDDSEKIEAFVKSQFNYPVVFKPLDGVSCEGLSVVKNNSQIPNAVKKIRSESLGRQFLTQKLIKGEAASVSLIATENKALPLSLNRQNITLRSSDEISSYNGGTVPLNHPLKQEAFELAKKIAGVFPGLRGYFGVDFILTEKAPIIVDVNPRLTTSYVGLSRVAKFNVAQALLNAVLRDELPDSIDCQGVACFSKIETSEPSLSGLLKTMEMHEVVSPPFPISGSKSCALIACKAETEKDAELRQREVKKRYLNIIKRGK